MNACSIQLAAAVLIGSLAGLLLSPADAQQADKEEHDSELAEIAKWLESLPFEVPPNGPTSGEVDGDWLWSKQLGPAPDWWLRLRPVERIGAALYLEMHQGFRIAADVHPLPLPSPSAHVVGLTALQAPEGFQGSPVLRMWSDGKAEYAVIVYDSAHRPRLLGWADLKVHGPIPPAQ